MEGKRTAQAEAARRGGAGIWIGLAAAAAVLAAGLGFCAYANAYNGVFPGVTMAGIELEGKGLKELRDTLTEALPGSLDRRHRRRRRRLAGGPGGGLPGLAEKRLDHGRVPAGGRSGPGARGEL